MDTHDKTPLTNDFHRATYSQNGSNPLVVDFEQPALHFNERQQGLQYPLDADLANNDYQDVQDLLIEYDETNDDHPITLIVRRAAADDATAEVQGTTPATAVSFHDVTTTNHGRFALFVLSPPPSGQQYRFVLGGNGPGFNLRVNVRRKA